MSTQDIILVVLVIVIAVGVFYMLDPTLGGIIRKKHEGFYGGDERDVIQSSSPDARGEEPTDFTNPGKEDKRQIMENPENASAERETVSPMMPMKEGFQNYEDDGEGEKSSEEGFQNFTPSPVPFAAAEKPANCYPKNQLAPQELLPNDPNSKWAQVNPMGSGDIAGKNFLNAGALIGVNTVGQSLRNASWDLRSEPPNPQVQVSPWMQSTIEPELQRRPLEIA